MKALVFDNDGTIADTHALLLKSFHHAVVQVLGHDLPDEQLMASVGVPLAVQMADFTDDEDEQRELLSVYRAYNHRIHDQLIKTFPGELQALEAFAQAGMPMAVVTSKLHALAQHGIELLGISPYMEFLIGADDCERAKPDPAPVLMACERLGLAPCECAYIGDSPFDMRAAVAAGCTAIGVTWGMFSAKALAAEHADFIVDSFEELRELVCGDLSA